MKNIMVWKMTACIAVVLLLFTTVLGSVFIVMFRIHTISINRVSMEKRAVSIAETLAYYETGGGLGTGRGGMGGYGAYLRFLNDLSMAEVWIVDENLNLLEVGHGRNAYSERLPDNADQIVKRVFEGETTYGEEFSGLLNTPSLTVGAPIRTENGITGAVLLHSSASGVEKAVFQGIAILALGAVVALLLAVVAAYWLSYLFTSPLRRMRTAAQHLAEGDYGAQTGVCQKDEIGQLAQTIDLLADRLVQAEQERMALDQLKQDFVANVSHELRTPVAVLRGSLEVLRDGTVYQQEEISDYYEQMLTESHHLERLVNDLLDLSRLQDTQFRLEMGNVNLCDVVWDAARAIQRCAQKKGLELSTSYPKEECIIAGDYGRIRQLLLILLDNAVKFSPMEETVEFVLEQKEEAFVISVANHGEEVPAEALSHIFDRFYKRNSTGNHSGTGLGLAIAKQIADRHNAEITVKSNKEKTRFMVTFKSR